MNPRAHIQEARDLAAVTATTELWCLTAQTKLYDLADALEACLDQQNQLRAIARAAIRHVHAEHGSTEERASADALLEAIYGPNAKLTDPPLVSVDDESVAGSAGGGATP